MNKRNNLSKSVVLVVDDRESNIDILVDVLGEDYKVRTAYDGKSALEDVRKIKPDLILLDIVMPGLSGYEVCRALKSNAETSDIPVLFLTAMTELKNISMGFELGAVDYITKPFEIVEVQARVKTHLSLKIANELLKREHERSENLLHNLLPIAIANRLKSSYDSIAERYDNVSVMFADIVNFTPLAQELEPYIIVSLLNMFFSYFDDLVDKYGLEKIKTIGDNYMVTAGIPEPIEEHAVAIARMAIDMMDFMSQHKTRQKVKLQLRIGIHSGSVVAGVIGKKKFIFDLWGDVVNTASRLESHGLPDKIQVSQHTYELLGSKFNFECRGSVLIKGKGNMTTYFLIDEKEPQKD